MNKKLTEKLLQLTWLAYKQKQISILK